MLDGLVEIIVIGYNLQKIEGECLSSITSNTTYRPYSISFFDNYESGLSLTEAWNWLINLSDAEFIVLLNNDTIVRPGWLRGMVEVFGFSDGVGFVGPSTNNCHSPQKNIPTFEEAQKHLGESQVMEQPISGFCLLFRKSLWNKLGGFDERFRFYGQESMFQFKAQQLGYKIVWKKDAFVYHIGEASIKTCDRDVEAERKEAKKLYWEEVEKYQVKVGAK